MSPMINTAIRVSKKAHRGQMRDDGEPFYNHPARVFSKLIRFGITRNDILIAALLHDTLEDTVLSPEFILKRFGNKVLDHIKTLTKRKGINNINTLKKAVKKSPATILIKISDRTDNLETIDSFDMERKKKYFDETIVLMDEVFFPAVEIIVKKDIIPTPKNELNPAEKLILNFIDVFGKKLYEFDQELLKANS